MLQHAGQVSLVQANGDATAYGDQRLGIEAAGDRRILWAEQGGKLSLERLYRPLAGYLARQMAAHPIGYDEQPQRTLF